MGMYTMKERWRDESEEAAIRGRCVTVVRQVGLQTVVHNLDADGGESCGQVVASLGIIGIL